MNDYCGGLTFRRSFWLFLCLCFCATGLQLVSSVIRSPFWGSGVFSSCCIYVSGLMQAVVLYLRVVVLCSVVFSVFGGLLVRVFSGFASLLRGVIP